MDSSLSNALCECRIFLPSDFSREHERLFCQEHLDKLSLQLETFFHQGVPENFPPPQLDVECTPSLKEAFAPFMPFLTIWYQGNYKRPDIFSSLAQTLVNATCKNILVLLGQRFTPASITDARAIPVPRSQLMASASLEYSDKLTAGARAWTKHVNRNSGEFWGVVTGSQEQKNEQARQVIEKILNQATWWNVFGHYKHSIVYEARVASGHGVRWGNDGQEFIGFLEPFTPGFPNVRI